MNKQILNHNYYQANKEKIKLRQKERYLLKKQTTPEAQSAKYYSAEAIKILMSFKEYTELAKDKRKLWLDFNWTLQDCVEHISEGLGDITAIMKLEQVANMLIRDYWTTAKSEIKTRSRNWNNLDYEEQQRLIKYWGREKARIENNFLDTNEQLEHQSREYLKEIELAKFHEERGKLKCSCYSCEETTNIRKEIKEKVFGYSQASKSSTSEKAQCASCGKIRKLDEENELCKNCLQFYE